MKEHFRQTILQILATSPRPLDVDRLAADAGAVDPERQAAFRIAFEELRDEGRLRVHGRRVGLPPAPARIAGTFRTGPRGCGFVAADDALAEGDVYIHAGETMAAMTGDRVAVRIDGRGRREGGIAGCVVEILRRGTSQVVGRLEQREGQWVCLPQGRVVAEPVVIDDVKPADREGVKVVVEIVRYPLGDEPAHGVIVENLGAAGPVDVETRAIIREYGLPEAFAPDTLEEARARVAAFLPPEQGGAPDREDFTGLTVFTIDPDDARDYDDAISIVPAGDGWTLGVHIADVSAFVPEGSALDRDAALRGNSVYFPRRVLPMLPEVLSNGVCSLQEGQPRWVKSAFLDFDRQGNVLGARFANGVIRSARRLTYTQAQAILDGDAGDHPARVVADLREMERLSRAIEVRRRAQGMLHLDLPEVDLVLSPDGRVTDANPPDASYTHTLIEMFMVEANEAVARLLHSLKAPFIRRIHPEGATDAVRRLSTFLGAVGVRAGRRGGAHSLQDILEAVKGLPQAYAVNLAVLKTLNRAEYSTATIGHFALASKHYCHFTSPIRRYPDLTVHRQLDAHLRGGSRPGIADGTALTSLAEHCTMTERKAEAAEKDLKTLLVLQLFAGRIGEQLEGVVTGVIGAGLFVQSTRYLVEGFLRLEDLGPDWASDPERGLATSSRTGGRLRLGDPVTVRIKRVDLDRRRLDLGLAARPPVDPNAWATRGSGGKDRKGGKGGKGAKRHTGRKGR